MDSVPPELLMQLAQLYSLSDLDLIKDKKDKFLSYVRDQHLRFMVFISLLLLFPQKTVLEED